MLYIYSEYLCLPKPQLQNTNLLHKLKIWLPFQWIWLYSNLQWIPTSDKWWSWREHPTQSDTLMKVLYNIIQTRILIIICSLLKWLLRGKVKISAFIIYCTCSWLNVEFLISQFTREGVLLWLRLNQSNHSLISVRKHMICIATTTLLNKKFLLKNFLPVRKVYSCV